MPAEAARRAYLEALGVNVWALKGAVPEESPADVAVELGPDGDDLPDWLTLREQVAACTLCPLHKTRTQTVFGVGSESADWMIIGEAPGAEEDRRGEPFVGRAGKLLDEMLRAVGLGRDAVFIANILKCRPPNNRDPAVDEAASCRAYHYLNGGQLPVVVTYHPAYLLRSPTQKRKAWQDLCLARQIVSELAA